MGLLGAVLYISLFSKWSDPITATVVDSETNQAIEGVVVVADWKLTGGFEGSTPAGHLAVMEAVTDNAGRFHFRRWGPRFSLLSGLRAEEPELFFFKSGYGSLEIDNQAAGRWHGMRVKSIVNGTRVKLVKFRGTPEEYFKNVQEFGNTLASNLLGDDRACPWKQIPRMINTMDEQIQTLTGRAQGRFSAPHNDLIAGEEYYLKIGCGSAKEFLTGIVK